MSDPKDSTQPSGSVESLPDSPPSGVAEGQPHSGGLTELPVSAFMKALENPDVRKAVGSILQSEKDRGVYKAVTTADEALREAQGLSEQLARLQPFLKNVSVEDLQQAEKQAELQDAVAWYREQRALRERTQGSVPNVSKAVQDIGNNFGLDWDDPGVKNWLANNPEPDIGKFAAYAAERKYTSPPASPAGISAPVGGSPPAGEFSSYSDDDLGTMLIDMAQKDPRGTKAERTKINKELERRASIKK